MTVECGAENEGPGYTRTIRWHFCHVAIEGATYNRDMIRIVGGPAPAIEDQTRNAGIDLPGNGHFERYPDDRV